MIATSLAIAVAGASTATAAENVEVWSYSIAEMWGLQEAFPLPAPPFTFLAGALFFQDKAVVVAGDDKAMADKKYSAIGLGYGLSVLAQMSSPPNMPASLKCVGDGKSSDEAMMVEGWDSDLTEVGAGMLCSYAHFNNANWRSSQLLTDRRRFLSVTEYRTDENKIERVYVDVTRWAEQLYSELP
jgi:hypothetical protein